MQQLIINQKFKTFGEVLKIIYNLERKGYSVISLEYVHSHLIIANKDPKHLEKLVNDYIDKLEGNKK